MSADLHPAELIFDGRADLGEGPLWNPTTQRLQFVDITAGRIHEFDPASGGHRSIDTGQMVGCLAPRAGGQLVAGLANGIWSVEPESGRITFLLAPPEHDAARCRFNDGKCDPQGRFWAGTMGLNAGPGAGALYCFPSGSESRLVLSHVSVSNGLAWSPDGGTMYYIDSPTRRVDAFAFDAETGRIGVARTVIVLPPGPDVPDGCTIDTEGMLWIAHWGGGRVTRWNPRRGIHLATIVVPAPRVTSCTFGDADLATLYITTARRGLDAATLAAFPESGGIFVCRPGVRGVPADVFRG